MADLEQKAEEHGTTIIKLIKVKENMGNTSRLFGNVACVMKHFREGDSEIMLLKIVPISASSLRAMTGNGPGNFEKLVINKIYAIVNHRNNSIEFGPPQGLFIEESLRGHGIGTYAFNEIIVWLRENFQEFSINQFEFVTPDNAVEEEKEMRNKYLENFGFSLNFTDVTQRSGNMKAKKPSLLKPYYNHEKIDELDIEKYFFNMILNNQKLEKDFNELKVDYEARGEELLGGLPKGDLIKYTVIGCIAVIVIMVLLTI